MELGLLYEDAGDVTQAERYYRFGFCAGRRFSARAARMRASHGLFRLARARGDAGSAAQFALCAQRVYEPDAAGAPELLLDLARFWMDAGEPGRARGALRRLWLSSLDRLSAGDRLSAVAITARVRASAGNPRMGQRAVRTAWELMSDATIRFAAAVDLAHAARITGDLTGFRRALRIVLRLAPQAEFPAVAERMTALWPDATGNGPRMERAS